MAKAVRRYPDSSTLWTLYGSVLLEQDKVAESKAALVAARRNVEENPWGLIHRAGVLTGLNEYSAAELDLQLALQAADPADRDVIGHVVNLRGKGASRRGDPEAEKLLREAVLLCPEDFYCWLDLAVEFYRAGQPEDAAATFDEADRLGVEPDLVVKYRQILREKYLGDGDSEA